MEAGTAAPPRSLDEQRKKEEATRQEQEERRRQAEAQGGEGEPGEEPPADPEGDELEGEGQGEQPDSEPQLAIQGMGSKLTDKVGGAKPDVSEAKMGGASVAIPEGQFEKGEVLEVVCKVQCTKVEVVDKMNNTTGERTETVRRHHFRTLHVERLT